MIINVRSAGESDDAFKFSDNIRAIIDKYYPNETTYLVGVTPSTQDIKDIIVPDYNRVNIVSLLGVALVVVLTYKALILPFVVLIPIECAIFINTALPYIYGQRTMYLGFIIVGCIQLGATIDYSILLTGNYLDARSQGDKKGSRNTGGIGQRRIGYDLRPDRYDGCLRSVLHDLGRGDLQSGPPDRPRRVHFGHHGTVLPADVSDAVRPLDRQVGLRRKRSTPR